MASSRQAPGQDALLGVQAVLGLVEHDRLRTVDHLGGHFLAAMRGRQCMKIASFLACFIRRSST